MSIPGFGMEAKCNARDGGAANVRCTVCIRSGMVTAKLSYGRLIFMLAVQRRRVVFD
jgi:hypothetical protein